MLNKLKVSLGAHQLRDLQNSGWGQEGGLKESSRWKVSFLSQNNSYIPTSAHSSRSAARARGSLLSHFLAMPLTFLVPQVLTSKMG